LLFLACVFICLSFRVVSRQNPVSETLCFKQRTGRWIMSRTVIGTYKFV
jgi:hypothetical protein